MLHSRSLRLGLFAGSLCLPLLSLGCPDTEARFDEFVDATKDMRLDAGEEESESESESDTGTPMGLDDMSGTYLFALEASIAKGLPLQFVLSVDMEVASDGMSATADFSFRPLSLMQGQTLMPRECLDEMLSFPGIPIDAAGNFEIDMGSVGVSGEANPITGSPIEATLVISGSIVHIDAFCGDVSGEVTSPLMSALTGSTFAAIRLADDGCTPATLPTELVVKCDDVPPPPGDGDGDTDTTDTGTDTDSDTTG